jgi:hypothetical protein
MHDDHFVEAVRSLSIAERHNGHIPWDLLFFSNLSTATAGAKMRSRAAAGN